MYLISAEWYKNGEAQFLRVRKTDEIWTSMKDAGNGMGVKDICDLVSKEMHGMLKTKSPTKEQINEYKMTEREVYEKFDNLSKEELNTKSNKIFTLEMMSWLLLLNVVEVKRKEA